jgi:predicted nucleotidyltransferase component of viral defense system
MKNYQWELKLLSSPVTVVQVMGQVATLKQIYKDKLACLKGRAKPKDLFDLWYVCQKLNIPYTAQKISLNKREVVRDLHKYLPSDFWPAIEGLTK